MVEDLRLGSQEFLLNLRFSGFNGDRYWSDVSSKKYTALASRWTGVHDKGVQNQHRCAFMNVAGFTNKSKGSEKCNRKNEIAQIGKARFHLQLDSLHHLEHLVWQGSVEVCD